MHEDRKLQVVLAIVGPLFHSIVGQHLSCYICAQYQIWQYIYVCIKSGFSAWILYKLH